MTSCIGNNKNYVESRGDHHMTLVLRNATENYTTDQ